MDLKKVKPSSHLEDRTAFDPFIHWLSNLPSSYRGLSKTEREIMKRNKLSVNDMYFRRALQGDRDTMINPEFANSQHPADQFMAPPPRGVAHPIFREIYDEFYRSQDRRGKPKVMR